MLTEAERLIEDRCVRVNGKTVALGDKALLGDAIFVNNKPLRSSDERSVTLVLNKPKGYTCTNADPHAEHTVFELLPPDSSASSFAPADSTRTARGCWSSPMTATSTIGSPTRARR